MTETMCDSGAVKLKAGSGVSTSLTAAHYTQLINQAESFVNATTLHNYTDTYSGLNDDLKRILEDAVSSHAALSAIGYDMTGYLGSSAQILLNVNKDRLMMCLDLLSKASATVPFINGT